MKRSPSAGGEVPSGVVTCTSTTPAPAGETAVIVVGDSTVKLAALVPPNFTAVASLRFEPVIVTVVPPVEGPVVGEMLVTDGHCGACKASENYKRLTVVVTATVSGGGHETTPVRVSTLIAEPA